MPSSPSIKPSHIREITPRSVIVGLIVAPPPVQEPKGAIAPKFEGATQKSAGLAAALSAVAKERECEFFDAGTVTTTSRVDGVHLDADQHERLGLAMADVVGPILHRVPLSAEQEIQ